MDIIKVNELDQNFKYEVSKRPGGEGLKNCFQCGSCSASCPVREMDEEYNPRRIIRMVSFGMKKDVLSSDFIWLCSTCYACHERCPQDVRITELMSAIKNIAVEEGFIPDSLRRLAQVVREHGRVYELGEFENKKRSRFNLSEIQERAEEIKKIFSSTGLDKITKG